MKSKHNALRKLIATILAFTMIMAMSTTAFAGTRIYADEYDEDDWDWLWGDDDDWNWGDDDDNDEPEVEEEFVPATTGLGGFVTRLYSVVLGRQPDKKGYDDWCRQLTSGESTGKKIAEGFFESTEFLNKGLSDSDYVDLLYSVFFNRPSDKDGHDYWMSKLASGMSRIAIRQGFYDSTEWANTCLSYGILSGGVGKADMEPVPTEGMENFVKALYKECLGREADEKGLNDWTRQLFMQEKTGKEVAYGFIFSKEFTERAAAMTPEELIKVFYTVFLNRDADEYGMADWKNRIAWGSPIGTLFSGFADSEEFKTKCASYGIICGKHIDVPGLNIEPEFLNWVTGYGWGWSGPMEKIELLDSVTLNPHRTYTEYTYKGNTYTSRQVTISDRDIQVLEQFARDHFGENWTAGQKVVYTAWWICNNSHYANGSDWSIIGGKGYADAIINCHLGQCAQYNGCLLEMMCWLGFDANMMFVPRNYGGGWQHYWCDVNINGTLYYMEAGNEGNDDTKRCTPGICVDYEYRKHYRPGLGL